MVINSPVLEREARIFSGVASGSMENVRSTSTTGFIKAIPFVNNMIKSSPMTKVEEDRYILTNEEGERNAHLKLELESEKDLQQLFSLTTKERCAGWMLRRTSAKQSSYRKWNTCRNGNEVWSYENTNSPCFCRHRMWTSNAYSCCSRWISWKQWRLQNKKFLCKTRASRRRGTIVEQGEFFERRIEPIDEALSFLWRRVTSFRGRMVL